MAQTICFHASFGLTVCYFLFFYLLTFWYSQPASTTPPYDMSTSYIPPPLCQWPKRHVLMCRLGMWYVIFYLFFHSLFDAANRLPPHTQDDTFTSYNPLPLCQQPKRYVLTRHLGLNGMLFLFFIYFFAHSGQASTTLTWPPLCQRPKRQQGRKAVLSERPETWRSARIQSFRLREQGQGKRVSSIGGARQIPAAS